MIFTYHGILVNYFDESLLDSFKLTLKSADVLLFRSLKLYKD